MAKEKKQIEDVLGEEDPLTATPDGQKEGVNPLEKMDEISKAKPQQKDSGSKTLDEDIVSEMFKTGENTDGMFTPDKKEELADEDEKAKLKVGKQVKPSKKYEKQFKDDMLKHPDQYKIVTPRGEMTIAEAIRAGYDPSTKQFDEKYSQDSIKQKHLSGLNDADRAALEQFTDPANAQVAPADAEKYGLHPGSPMIRPEEQPNPGQAINPMMMGSAQQAPATPIGGAIPGAEESMAPGGSPDIAALLGGGQ